jgi:hypothetical protein
LGDFSSCLLEFFKRKNKCSQELVSEMTSKTEDENDILTSISICVEVKWGLKDTNTIKKYTNCIWDIIRSKNLDLFIYEHSFNDTTKNNFDFAIFKAIINFNKEYKKFDLFKLIEMTIDWNRFDVAKKELFNDNIDWVSINQLN